MSSQTGPAPDNEEDRSGATAGIIALVAILVVVALGSVVAIPVGIGLMVASIAGDQQNQRAAECNPAANTDHPTGDWQAPEADAGVAGLSKEQVQVAKQFWLTAHEVGMGDKAALAGITMAKQESDLGANPAAKQVNGDGDVGPAQQRSLPGWYGGKQTQAENVAVLINPANAARIFYTGQTITGEQIEAAHHAGVTPAAESPGYHIPGLKDIKGWEGLATTVAVQRVQRSAYPDAYARWDALAKELVASFGTPPRSGPQGAAERETNSYAGDGSGPAGAGGCTGGPAIAPDCPETGLPAEKGMSPDALAVMRCAKKETPNLPEILGIGDRPAGVDRDHQEGRAVDLMIGTDMELGGRLSDWAEQNARQLGVKYIIWDAHIWSVERADEGWRMCGTAAASCYSGPDDTQAHRDHVHISVIGTATVQAAAQGNGEVAAGGGANPLRPGTYSLGARWGATGSWSRYHTGQDLSAAQGTSVYAAAGGRVVPANGGSWAGTHVVVQHPDGSATLYAHLSAVSVQHGQPVEAGQQLGKVGQTGRAFGPHLHFEYYPQVGSVGNPYKATDPYKWMTGLGVRL